MQVALDHGDQPDRHRGHVLHGRVGGDRRQGAPGQARRGDPRQQGALPARGRASTAAGTREAAPDPGRGRASLGRLGTDYLDLYQVHRPDWTTDIEETLWVLTDLVRAGKIRAFGLSTYPAHEIVEAHRVAEARGLMRPRTEQPPYNLLARGIERDVLPVTERWGMGVLTWSPLGFGFLTGRHRKGATPTSTGRVALRPAWFDPDEPAVARKLDVVESLMRCRRRPRLHPPRARHRVPAGSPRGDIGDPRTAHPAAARGIARRRRPRARRRRPGSDRRDRAAGHERLRPQRRLPPPWLAEPGQRRRPRADRLASVVG